jgi:hypothetical protein
MRQSVRTSLASARSHWDGAPNPLRAPAGVQHVMAPRQTRATSRLRWEGSPSGATGSGIERCLTAWSIAHWDTRVHGMSVLHPLRRDRGR